MRHLGPICPRVTEKHNSLLSPARRKQLDRMIRRSLTINDNTPVRRILRWRKEASEFARDNGIPEAAIFECVVLPTAVRGGRREKAGRKSRHWPSALCGVDNKGPINGPDLFSIEFALVVRLAADPKLGTMKAAFKKLASSASETNGTIEATWEAYRHALRRLRKDGIPETNWYRQRRALARLRLGIAQSTGRSL